MIAALVPVKRLDEAKSRLLAELEHAAAARLVLAMLADVVEALRQVERIARVVVVTPDAEVVQAAEHAGAEAMLCREPGLNPSLDAAAAQLAREGAEAQLVVLGDVPGVLPRDLEAMLDALDALGGRGVVLAGSRDGGSSALLRAPHDCIASCFGRDSAQRHQEAAKHAGVPFTSLQAGGLAIDLDRADDLRAFLDTPEGGSHTRALLVELGFTAQA